MNVLPREFLLAKAGVCESYPFEPEIPVYKVANKIFAIGFCKEGKWYLNLKITPQEGEVLRSLFSAIKPGYHMNKKHWNTIVCAGQLDDDELKDLIRHSYELVTAEP